jgi:hypothetical protein
MFSHKILLSKNEDIKAFEEEQRQCFLYQLLSNLGVSLSEVWEEDAPISILQKIELLKILRQRDLTVIEEIDGSMEVFLKDEKIGEFKKCNYKLKQDLSEKDAKKRLYFEAEVTFWTIFEQANNT